MAVEPAAHRDHWADAKRLVRFRRESACVDRLSAGLLPAMSPPIRPSGTFPRKREKGAALAVRDRRTREKGSVHAGRDERMPRKEAIRLYEPLSRLRESCWGKG
ncbi:hypothetical protein FICKIIDM_03399 [Xanthomonas citri pv. punicae]|nr:hypothetical protein FICKIIDM_03399 [Xanthomonas citri pv. punicae]